MNQAIRTSVWIVCAAGLLAACAAQPAAPQTATLAIEAKEFQFSPNTLEAVAGKPVKLTMTNAGTLTHDFSIMEMAMDGTPIAPTGTMPAHDMGGTTDEPAVHMAVANGSSGTIEFTPTTPGTYTFFCTVSGHKQAGMTGALTVTAP
jgi:uncharacterized cupredoxin-like copper-binding protein